MHAKSATLYIRRRPDTYTGKAREKANKAPWDEVFRGPLAECRKRMEAVNDREPRYGAPRYEAYINATACEYAADPRTGETNPYRGRFATSRPFTAIDTLADALAAARRAGGGA